MTRLHTDDLAETLRIFNELEQNQTAAAAALGIARSTLQERLKAAAAKAVEPALSVHGKSTLYRVEGPDGEKLLQWVKESVPGGTRLAAREVDFQRFQEALKEVQPLSLINPPSVAQADIMAVYPIADLHLGMYSWKAETGEDYDLEVAKRIALTAFQELISTTPASETAIILNLGDFFHSDSNDNRTRKSGNVLDVDTRYAKVLEMGNEILIQLVALALQKHQRVLVRNIQGNHDPYATLALNATVSAYFRENPRVIVHGAQSPFFFNRFGRVMIGATHGDMAKPDAMVNIMASKAAEDWGQSDYRYVYMGHVHKRGLGGGDLTGATWETFQTLAPRDAWGNSMGFTAPRSATAIILHATRGEMMRLTYSVKGHA